MNNIIFLFFIILLIFGVLKELYDFRNLENVVKSFWKILKSQKYFFIVILFLNNIIFLFFIILLIFGVLKELYDFRKIVKS